MTRFSAPDVHQCPACDSYLLWSNMMSFNTFGDRMRWSDGCMPFSGMLTSCKTACCPTCRAVLWKDDLAVLGVLRPAPRPVCRLARQWARWFGDKRGYLRREAEWQAIPDEWKVAGHNQCMKYADMQHAVATQDAARELFLRRRIWWETNDHQRSRSDGERVATEPVAPEADRRANMLRMIALLEAASDGLDERAELLRNLGQFDAAIALLTSGAAEISSSSSAAWTLRWARASDAQVRVLGKIPAYGNAAPPPDPVW